MRQRLFCWNRSQVRSGEDIEDSGSPDFRDSFGFWGGGSDSGSGGFFTPPVSPRVQEAFGGSLNANKAILRLITEFESADTDVEQCAIIGVHSESNHAFRIWSDSGNREEVAIPFADIIQIISADPLAFQYGWVFAHTHHLSKKPSNADNTSTCALAWIGKMLDMPMVDHWIFTLGNPHFYSYSVSDPRYLSPSIKFEIESDG